MKYAIKTSNFYLNHISSILLKIALVRALNGQKYMFTYQIEGQFRFMFILCL